MGRSSQGTYPLVCALHEGMMRSQPKCRKAALYLKMVRQTKGNTTATRLAGTSRRFHIKATP